MDSARWRNLFRAAGSFLLNFLLATIATNVLASPFDHAFATRSASQMLLKEEILGAVFAFGLGYLFYATKRATAAKWIWLVGLGWFLAGMLLNVTELRSAESVFDRRGAVYMSHSLYWKLSGSGCPSDTQSCMAWSLYTLQFLGTAFYSAGAVCCSRFGFRKPIALG